MRIAIDSFRGEVPRLTPRALPANAAQAAVNCKLMSGDVEAWRQFLSVKTLTAGADVKTTYLLNDQWLSWTVPVDVARGVIAGDNTFRIYFTAPGTYTTPRWTNYSLATTGAEPYPVAHRPIGVPAPTSAPTVAVDVTATEDSNVTLTNPGAEVGSTTGWTVDTGGLVVVSNGDIVGLNAQAGTKFFGSTNVATTRAHQDAALTPAAVLAGQSLRLAWHQARGANSSTASMGIEFYDTFATIIGSITQLPETAPAVLHTWERRELDVKVPNNAVTARLAQLYTRVGAAMDAYIDNITLNTVDYSNTFDGSTLDGWDVSPSAGTPGSSSKHRSVVVEAGLPWTPYAWRLRGDEMAPWLHRSFATDQSPAIALKFKFQTPAIDPNNGVHVKLFASDAGAGSNLLFNRGGIFLCTSSSWDDAAIVSNLGTPLLDGEVYTISLRAEKSGLAEAIVTIDITDSTGAVTVANLKTKFAVNGPRVGFVGSSGSLDGSAYITNVFITVTAPKSLEEVNSTATSYVFRFVNDLGEASAPSLASQVVVRPDGGSVIITMPTVTPGDASYWGTPTLKQIYRAVTGASGTAYIFVAEIALATATYTDSFDDSDIADNEVLDSEDWDLPLDGMQGIIALPNGMMAGFYRNQLCLSVSGHPHAWRVQDRHTTDTDIVKIANIDNTIVLGTKSRVYVATGNSNDSYAMSMPGALQACVSARGMVFLDGVGVVFPSPDGWIACAGSAGNVVNITEGVFKKTQWEALDPTSIVASVHDGILFWFSTGQAPDSGYALDVRPNGFGLVSLAFHANALFADPLSDKLYMVLDVMSEPTEAALPIASTAPAIGSSPFKVIHQFDGHATNLLRYRFKGKLHLLPYPGTLPFAQVQAPDFANLVLRTYADGSLLSTKLITNAREFLLPALATHDSYEMELVGTTTGRTVQLCEDVGELV